MPGIPVVILDSGGVPVTAVDSGAPVMTVAENGAGMPITLTENAAPFILEGYNLDPPVSLVGFELDSMSGNGGDIGYYRTIYGEITPEPLVGFPLVEFAWRNSSFLQVAFEGNAVEYLQGFAPAIDGVDIGDMMSDWTYDAETNTTSANWSGGSGLSSNTVYQVTWAQPAEFLALASDDGAPLLADNGTYVETYDGRSTT